MASDGIVIGPKLAAVTTGALQPGDEPVASASTDPDVIHIRIYLDYQCELCQKFESANAKQIAAWAKSGAATVEIHPLAIFDRNSVGAKYSTRSANAAACVANFSPDKFFRFNSLLFDNQPAQQTEGLSDAKLVSLTKRAQVKHSASIASCIDEQTFKTWVNAATARAATGPIPGSKVGKVTQTPTVLVNGVKYSGAFDKANEFALFVNTAAGNAFVEESTASPTPSPSVTPAP
ncbi:MAG: thioredoxin domain-containing protein [Lacisediminihabitans sp.]